MKRTTTTSRSSGRPLQFFFSRPRRWTTYVKPPRARSSVISVRQALRGLAALAALQLSTPAAFAAGNQLDTSHIQGTVTSGQVTANQTNATTTDVLQGTTRASADLTRLTVP